MSRPYTVASAQSARRVPTSCLFRGWMFLASPISMMTACPVFGSPSAIACASRSSAHASSAGWGWASRKFASCTNPNGKSPRPHCARQSEIMLPKIFW